MAGEGDAIWVMAGVLVCVKELAYMMIAHMSEGDYDRDHVSALGNDRDHVVDWAVTISPQIYGSLKSVPRVALTVDPRPGDHPHVLGSALVSPGTVGEITDAAATFLGTYAGLVYA